MAAIASSTLSPIVAQRVAGNRRMQVLPKAFPNMFVMFESLVYRFMDQFVTDYNGGYWEYFTLSNNGFYMSLDGKNQVAVSIASNYFEGVMSADAASLVANLYAIHFLAYRHESDHCAEMYHRLLDFVRQHEESHLIRKAID